MKRREFSRFELCKRICEAAGEEQVWHNAKLAVAPQAPEPSGRMNGAYTEAAKMPRADVKLWSDPAFNPFDRPPGEG